LPVIFLSEIFIFRKPRNVSFRGCFIFVLWFVCGEFVEYLLEFWHTNLMSVEVNKNFIKILGNSLDKRVK